MDKTDLDHQAIAFVNVKLFEGEAELFETKWWDYRRLHPIEATELFANAYVTAKKRAIKQQIDLYIGANARILKKDSYLLESKATVTGLWKARKAADSFGIPYDFWCSNAMSYADACCWPYLPNPTHLYTSSTKEDSETMSAISMIDYIRAKWSEWCFARTVYGEDDFYLINNFVNHPDQVAHQQFLLQQVGRRVNPAHSLATLVFEKALLSVSIAEENFGKKTIERAKNLAD